MRPKTIKTDYLCRVEGEAGLYARILEGRVEAQFRVFEAPRFFESFLRGRPYQDIIDFTARICGICPVAYQMSSAHAIEKIFGVQVERPIRQLRRLFYAGEWIESHALHVYILNGPDFYGAASAWENRSYLPYAKQGLDFKRLGNRIMAVIGGRPVHPVSAKAGGFFKLPQKKELAALIGELEDACGQSLKAISWAAGLPFQSVPLDTEYVALRHPDEYPMNEGRVVSSHGLDVGMDTFQENIRQDQVAHSNALHWQMQKDGKLESYLVGPLARVNLNFDLLPKEIKDAIKKAGVEIPINNIEMGIVARCIEIAYAFHEAVRIIKEYEEPFSASAEVSPRAGTATWITEAPRGILIHRYTLEDKGRVTECHLIPPTAQNAAHIERTLHNYLERNSEKQTEALRKECERIIRAYDPCISCSVHLVKM